MPHTTLASNLPCSGFLFGLFLASHSSNVQSDSLRLSFWTFSVPHTTLTSNPPRVDFSFGLLLASRSSNVQPDVSPTRGRTSIGHFLRTVQYMPVCFAPCSCVSFPFLEPFLSFFCTLGNTLILQSGEHIQHRTPYNS